MSSVNVALYLSLFAQREPDRAAVIVARTGHSLSFRELNDASDALARGLIAAGITRGTHVAVMVPPSLEFFTLVFALFKAAAVPVMIDPGMGAKNLGVCLEESQPQAFIGIAKAHLARQLFGWAKSSITVNVGRTRFFCDHSLRSVQLAGSTAESSTLHLDVDADDTAAILFTSGSTGIAKGVVYTHGIFAAQVELLKTLYGIEPGEVDLCTFPLFALFGPALGMTCVVPTMNFSRPATINPQLTIDTINKYQATNLFGSPAVIRALSYRNVHLPTLRRAISAGAPATLDVIERFTKLIHEPRPSGSGDSDAPLRSRLVFTPYGATEALPVANIASDELLATRHLTETGHGLCIGRPVPGVTVHIIPIDDGPVPVFESSKCLPPGEIGEFVVRGPIVTKSYWKRDNATNLAKMHDPATGEILHRMGDVGYYDEQGRLWFCGRKSQRVVTEHGTLFTDQVEPIFNSHLGRTALVCVRGRPVLCCETGLERSNPPCLWLEHEVMLRNLARKNTLTQHIHDFLGYCGSFPVDPRHNSKINREKLALWAAKQLST